ncbi:copper homeostasis protein CutC [uncultured Muriicola sp.]|uniref:copper homeostasis protein CutC n=1 Tax=uncultured Muriicola sp. TaxID=1583102 RepID=UPI00262ABF81|nr:copper homeostasis protein CutC [uncultured Muriicola sp.]
MIVEVCANSLESALNAQLAGAQRIELCSELTLGGITPSYGLIKKVMEAMNIPVHVLIRPRSGDFYYSDAEFQTMVEDIAICKSLGVDGIVSGVLRRDLQVDWDRTIAIKKASGSCSFTFHRAFDLVANPLETFDKIQEMGVDTLLTSGQARSAMEGLSLLKQLEKKSNTCTIMPGAGIRDTNAIHFKHAGFKAIHLSATIRVLNTIVLPQIPMNAAKGIGENEVLVTDPDILKKVIKSVN